MIQPNSVCFYIPPELRRFKLELFNRIGSSIERRGGRVVRGDVEPLDRLPDDIVPIVGCTPTLTPLIAKWRQTGRRWIYFDRGYARRVFATWLPRGESGGYYRFHLGSFQLQSIGDAPSDRWNSLKINVQDWRRTGKHIVIAAPTRTYSKFHGTQDWIADTIDALARVTDRQLVIRDKESKRSLQSDLDGAHALVSHGSIAAVEAAILGCPVFVHRDSAAALVGQTDLIRIEQPVYPDRQKWLNALAYSQFSESEMVDGTTLWKLLGQ